jgi:hypothetical protein
MIGFEMPMCSSSVPVAAGWSCPGIRIGLDGDDGDTLGSALQIPPSDKF